MMSALSLATSVRIPWPRRHPGSIVDTVTDHGLPCDCLHEAGLPTVLSDRATALRRLHPHRVFAPHRGHVLRVSAEQKRFRSHFPHGGDGVLRFATPWPFVDTWFRPRSMRSGVPT